MIDKKEFKQIEKELQDFDDNREKLIRSCRDVIKVSKQIIYSIHRDNLKEASSHIKTINSLIKKLPDQGYDQGIYFTAIQEYVEAISLYEFVTKKKIPTKKELKVDTESYLCGLCDLTGELVRRAVGLVMKKKYDEVNEIYLLVEELYSLFLLFNLRNGELRKKSDQIKWNLKKLEEIILALSLRK